MAALPLIEVQRKPRTAGIRYGVAVGFVGLSVLARLVLQQYMGAHSPYVTFVLAVVLSSWFGGLGPGVAATFLSVAATWFLVPFPLAPSTGEWFAASLFLLQGLLISYFLEMMHRSKRRVAGIVESISDGFAVFDNQWRILYVNENGAAIAHRSPGQLIGRSLWESFPDLVGSEFWQRMHEAMRGQRPVHFEQYAELRQRWYEHNVYPAPSGLIIFSRDITERKIARSELEAAKGQIERLNEELEQRVQERTAQLNTTIKELEAFSYSVSHDLRAPLRAIDGFSRLLFEDYHEKLDAEGRRIIDVIRNSTVRMGELIDGLLAFSRLGRQAMASSQIDMTELARDAFNEANETRDETRIHFNVGGLPPATGDRLLLRQVFINLLSNALKFTRDQDPAVIDVGSLPDDEQNVFYVRDNGVGFDMRYVDKLFGVFQRLHGANEFEGTGLGLAIVQRIVHRHGGRVWAEGAPGKGATIFFSLPRCQSTETRRSA